MIILFTKKYVYAYRFVLNKQVFLKDFTNFTKNCHDAVLLSDTKKKYGKTCLEFHTDRFVYVDS